MRCLQYTLTHHSMINSINILVNYFDTKFFLQSFRFFDGLCYFVNVFLLIKYIFTKNCIIFKYNIIKPKYFLPNWKWKCPFWNWNLIHFKDSDVNNIWIHLYDFLLLWKLWLCVSMTLYPLISLLLDLKNMYESIF